MPQRQPDVVSEAVSLCPWLYQLARFLGARPEEAEDLVQDAMVELLESPPEYRGAEALRGWLAVVMKRRWFDRTRRPGGKVMTVICGSCFKGEHMCGGDCDCQQADCQRAREAGDA